MPLASGVAASGAARPRTARSHALRLVPRFMHPHESELDRTRTDRTQKDWLLDVLALFLAAGFGFSLHFGQTVGQNPGELLEILDLVMILPAGVLLFWRRRWPLTIAVILPFLGLLSSATGVACLISVYAVAAYSSQARAFVGLGVQLALIPLTAAIWASSEPGPATSGFWGGVVFGTLLTVGVFAWGLFAGARLQLLLSLEDRAARAESEQQLRVDQARQQERTRIAREMHDVLAHRMSLLSVHAGALEFRPDAPPEEVARAAGVIRATAHEALEELRTVIGVMRVADVIGDGRVAAAPDGVPEAPQPSLAEVPRLVEQWQAAGARIDFSLAPSAVDGLPATISRTAYRVVQESLTNAGKHAPSAKIVVMVGGTPGESLTVSVTNPIGVASPASAIPGTGLGLVGLRERTELVGGVFAAGFDPDLRRFVVEARLPWSPA